MMLNSRKLARGFVVGGALIFGLGFSGMAMAGSRISSGLKVGSAKDNAAITVPPTQYTLTGLERDRVGNYVVPDSVSFTLTLENPDGTTQVVTYTGTPDVATGTVTR